MVSGLLRVKLALLEHGRRLAILSVLLGVVLAGWAGVAYSQPQTETVRDEVQVQAVATAVDSSAIVTGNSTLWETGQALENRPFYPASAPVLSLRVVTTAPADRTVELSHSVTVVYQAVRSDTVIWERREVVLDEGGAVSDGELASTSTLDTRQVRQAIERINDELTGVGSARVRLLVNTTYDTGRYQGTLTKTATLRVVESGYWIAGDLDAETTHSTTVTRQVTSPPERQSYLVPGLAGLGSFAAGSLVWFYRRRGPDPATLRDRLEQARYGEWISSGYLGGDLADRQVQIRTLADLIDIGIDSDKRTIHDPDRGLYGVIDGEVLYYYPTTETPLVPEEPSDGWEWPFEDPAVDFDDEGIFEKEQPTDVENP